MGDPCSGSVLAVLHLRLNRAFAGLWRGVDAEAWTAPGRVFEDGLSGAACRWWGQPVSRLSIQVSLTMVYP